MKIALLRQRVGGPGGAETTLGYLARGLASAGHEVTVYAAQPEDEARAALGPGVGYVTVPVWGGKTGRLLTYALNTRHLLARARPQVVFSLERTPGAQVYRAGDGCHREWLARRAPTLSPPARLAQRLSPFHRTVLALEQRLFAHPALRRVIANSRQVQGEILRHYGVDPARIRVIYNGLDRGRFHPLAAEARAGPRYRLGAPEGAAVILFVGSGFQRKGLAYLIAACGSLKNQNWVLWVVGKGSIAAYQRLAQGCGVAARVKFWGPQAEAAPFYQAATVLALPTLYDPCSNVVLEALGCGTPVITTGANGAGEFISPGVNGEVLPQAEELGALAQALDLYLDRGEDPLVRRAAAAAVAHLSWESTVTRTLEVLAEAAS
jgi:UDP-glucose:(heptosyl)LPS alpha-1,3-glucosyltransferase